MLISDSILERASAMLPGITEDYLRAEFRALVGDFCRGTTAWRMEVSGVGTTNFELDLNKLTPPAPGRVLGALGSIKSDNYWIHPDSYRRLNVKPTKTPRTYTTKAPSYTILTFWADLTEELTNLTVQFYMMPFDNGQLPQEICANFEEGLLAGLVGRMMRKPKKPYTDLKLGAENMTEYRMAVKRARIQTTKMRTTAPAPWAYPGWG